jgi:cell division initiation protein
MILTPQDIQSQQFHVRFRGFDVEEVDDFLEKISAAFQSVTEENQQLKGRLETLEKDLATYQNQQKSFQSAIIAAQNVADAMKEKSREEAEAIVAEAREEARLRRAEANREITELKSSLDRLTALKQQAAADLRHQLESYLQMLEPEPVDSARAIQHGTIPAAEPRTRTAEKAQAKSPDLSEEMDLTDLYVKIDIPDSGRGSVLEETGDDFFTPQDISMDTSFSDPEDFLIMDGDEDSSLPDLDGEMVFSLEDPLEEHEPIVSFAEDLEESKKKGPDRFNPDESPL